MLHERPGGYDPPASAGPGFVYERRAWTGQKRRKIRGPSLTRDSGEIASADTASSSSGARGNEIWPSVSPDEQPFLDTDIISEEELRVCHEIMSPRHALLVTMRRLDGEQQREVNERLALYRIRAYKLLNNVSRNKLDDMTLRKEYSSTDLEKQHYFKSYEQDGAIGWYFDYDYSKLTHLGDYQRLVLKNDGGARYLDWEMYRSNFTTYAMDVDYVKCCKEISRRIKWIKSYMEYGPTSDMWMKMHSRGGHQALKIAAGYTHMSIDAAYTAYKEHIWSLNFDYWHREDIDTLFFEIWKRVTQEKIAFRKALQKVYHEDLVPRHRKFIRVALDYSEFPGLKLKYDICVDGISVDSAENEAQKLIKWAVWNKLRKQELMHQYVTRKMAIAEHIGLNPQV